MNNRPLGLNLYHIAEAFRNVLEYTAGMSYGQFSACKMCKDAVIRNYEIIGEAAKNIPDDYRAAHSEIDWRGLAGFRDVLIHQYFGINLETVWQITQSEARSSLAVLESLPEYKSAAAVYAES